MRQVKIAAIVLLFCLVPHAWAELPKFQPFWDFRQWGGVAKQTPIYQAYMKKFAEHGVTAVILINKNSLPPFARERKFLADASRYGIKVWIRTNRVTPKRGIPHRPNSTLDFALDKSIQQESLEYLLALAALSKDYPNLTGLVIGGEELVGAKVNKAVLARYDEVSRQNIGFAISGPLNNKQKIIYFDWLEELQNRWYARIWDTIKAKYPQLKLFIYPSSAAVCGDRYSRFPRPAYWDIYDLIVTRKKPFGVIIGFYSIQDPLENDITAAMGKYLKAATENKVPYYLLLQVHRASGQSHTPTPPELEAQVKAAIDGGARGVGYWPHDIDTKKDIYGKAILSGPSSER
ncbi:MAG: hypothetical protein P8X58_14010 [Syntrophobacterales bacterium]